MTIEMEFVPVRQQFMADYHSLKEHFLELAKTRIAPSVLDDLKATYSGVINSVRCTDYIDSVEGLLRMLEKRGALSYDNVEPLKHISSNFVNDPGFERALSEYEVRICRSPALPLCNIYDMPGGKYVEAGPRSRHRFTLNRSDSINEIRSVTLNRSDASVSNSSESTNDNDFNDCKGVSRVRRENESSSEDRFVIDTEDRFVIDTEAFVPYRHRSVQSGRRFANGSVFAAKVRKRICSKFGIGVTGALLGVGLVIMFVTVSNLLHVQSSASGFGDVEQPYVSGVETVFNGSRSRGIQARMTVNATRTAFRVTLPGSILLSPTASQGPVRGDSEEARMVLLEISDRLGRSWRDVARHLGVRERDIDEIDQKHNLLLKEKAFQALKIFQNKCDPSQWIRKLKRALDEARRRDLMEMVDELIEQSRSN